MVQLDAIGRVPCCLPGTARFLWIDIPEHTLKATDDHFRIVSSPLRTGGREPVQRERRRGGADGPWVADGDAAMPIPIKHSYHRLRGRTVMERRLAWGTVHFPLFFCLFNYLLP